MQMSIGEKLRLTIFGTSHGPMVGAFLTGVPKGIKIDPSFIQSKMDERKPGGKYASKRKEEDKVIFKSGITDDNETDGEDLELHIPNKDVRTKDYSFLPNQPRPGHQDMVMMKKTDGSADLRGGGVSSARLTAPIVAAAAIIQPLLDDIGVSINAHVSAIGEHRAKEITKCPINWPNQDCFDIRCKDDSIVGKMIAKIEQSRKDLDSIGSEVEICISGMPMGIGEPWFDGLEPALARAFMAIPAARGVAFGRGFSVVKMTGSQHNDPWTGTRDSPKLSGEKPDGAIAGLSTGSNLIANIAFKPPSSIAKEQTTLNLATNEQETLQIKGRHDPVLAPRAVAVAEAMAKIVICDLALRGGFIGV